MPYLLSFILFALTLLSFTKDGFITYAPVIYSFMLIPLFELLGSADPTNHSKAEQKRRLSNKQYDYLLYLVVPLQFLCLIAFLITLRNHPITDSVTYWGWVSSMGLLNGVFGINVAHELGHRPKKNEQRMAQLLLMTSLYMHFFIEHNRGHHKYVATPKDPASARKWEPVYLFWFRSIAMSWISSWKLEEDRLKRKNKIIISWENEMLRFTVIQLVLCLLIYLFFGIQVLIGFFISAILGIVLLETVNYIEHYGLRRQKVSEFRYENVLPKHSWNSNHKVGRWMLFELSRHSDHHHRPARKYQILEHHEDSPQMPTGYPGMMLISLVPPLFYSIVHPRLKKISMP